MVVAMAVKGIKEGKTRIRSIAPSRQKTKNSGKSLHTGKKPTRSTQNMCSVNTIHCMRFRELSTIALLGVTYIGFSTRWYAPVGCSEMCWASLRNSWCWSETYDVQKMASLLFPHICLKKFPSSCSRVFTQVIVFHDTHFCQIF